jgi:tripeptide aminopeptidase
MSHLPRRCLAVLTALTLSSSAAAQVTTLPADRTIQTIRSSPGFKAAAATLDREHERIVAETIRLTEIPAPPFKETARAQAYLAMLKDAGLSDLEMDAEGNVMGLRRGSGPAGGQLLVMAAHLDTVFPEGTDLKVRREGNKLFAPGVGDNSQSLAVMLAYVRALNAAKIKTRKDILFVGNVGEEGPGDLRGVRYLFGKGKYKDRIAAFLAMDGTTPFLVTSGAVGSRRYKVTFKGPGGHSFGAFGIVNPMAAMATAVVEMNRIQAPANPRTTYATSVVSGGTSVNSIPDAIALDVDMRSAGAAELALLDSRFLQIVAAAVEQENKTRSTRLGTISAEIKLTGDRPTGQTSETAPIIQLTAAAVRAAGYQPLLTAGSTDSNLPISLGIPAVTIGTGAGGGRAHAIDEWIDVSRAESVKGMTMGLAVLIALADMGR